LFEQPGRLQDPVKVNGRRNRAFSDIGSEIFVGRCVDAEPGANQIADGFSLKLANGMR